MFQTDSVQNKDGGKKGFPVQNDQHDELLTQSSDIPVYDVLGGKYFASPDKLEFIRQSFSLPQLTTVSKKKGVCNFDPVSNKVVPQNKTEFFLTEPEEVSKPAETIQTQESRVVKEAMETGSQTTSFDLFIGKETPVKDSFALSHFPQVEKTELKTQTLTFNTLVSRRDQSEQLQFTNVDWATGLYVLLLVVLAYTRISFGRFFQPIFQSVFVYNLSVRIFSEKSLVLGRLSGILNFLFVLSFTALVTLAFDFYGFKVYNLPTWQNYFVFLGLFLIFFLLRKMIHFFLGSIFSIREIITEYSFQGNLYLKLTGIMLLPLILAIPYIQENHAHILFVASTSIIGIIYFFRILRTFSITIRKGFSIFYLILYLCALEIGPCLVFFKMLGGSM